MCAVSRHYDRYNLLVKGTMEHRWIGTVPTHSLVFSSSTIIIELSIILDRP